MFLQSVKNNSNKIAIKFASSGITYKELDNKSNQFAIEILKQIKPNSVVGIAMNRSVELIASVLGVIKSGCTCLPLDLSYPDERLKFMIDDAEPQIVLTNQQSKIDSLGINVPKIYVEEIGKNSETKFKLIQTSTEDLIYVIYTSGSTGKPKGIKMPHRVIENLINWQNNISTPGQFNTLQFAPISFDVSFQEIFSTLTSGGTLILTDEETRRDPLRLVELIIKEKVERIFLPYIALQNLAEASELKNHKRFSLKHIITAGEQLIVTPQIRKFLELQTDILLHNQYGPSETHVATSYILSDKVSEWPLLPPIGKAISNTVVLLLDDKQKEVAPGEIGEIYIGGTCVSKGYLNREELTFTRFVNLPDYPGKTFYKTGDLGTINSSGQIEFLGRADNQIKLYGYRIELGEIENIILQYPGLSSCAVALKEFHNSKSLVAYLCVKEKEFDVNSLKTFLQKNLPDYMLPKFYVLQDSLPVTPSGKIDKAALPLPSDISQTVEDGNKAQALIDEIEDKLIKVWKEILNVDHIKLNDNFFDLGGDSILLGRLQIKLKQNLGEEISVVDLFAYPTIAQLRKFISIKRNLIRQEPKEISNTIKPSNSDIAIIGISGRYPKAKTIKEFWENLVNGLEAISFFTDDELEIIPNSNPNSELKFVKARGVLEDADKFDAEFFGFNPKEASIMDPQHRVFLECCWNALEDSGYVPEKFNGSIGIFAGSSLNTYLIYNVLSDRNKQEELANSYQIADYTTLTGNDNGFLTTKVAYKLGLKGPAINVQTACSTSLVAIGQAYQSLVTGQCDMALAGGVSISFPQKRGYYFVDGSIGSVDGHCKPFDADATGTVFSSGAGVVVLKRLDDAIRDGDSIYAVIKSVALNNDGSDKAGYMTPSIDGQTEVILKAQQIAGVNPETIKYVEAHGTGTPVGDPIEVTALEKAFRTSTDKKQFCGIGSVKSNIGHTDAAAGVTGLIKAALTLKHRTIPPTLHFKKPNPRFDFSKSPFYVVDKLTRIEENSHPIRAAVSSFGVGGTNAHAILEEFIDNEIKSDDKTKKQLIIVSAKNENSLKANATVLA
ncbi:MAG: amino acid adenylation domain-containing protein, partial [Ignavibacterium sp.]|nr:amino acid adenylation domain-containing protein [Ignavibacterium sp.]